MFPKLEWKPLLMAGKWQTGDKACRSKLYGPSVTRVEHDNGAYLGW